MVRPLPIIVRSLTFNRRYLTMSESDPKEILDELFRRVADTRHDVKNPLSIISGNAQLLREMTRAMELGEDFAEPIRDIEEATERIRDSLDRMDDLKQSIASEREQWKASDQEVS